MPGCWADLFHNHLHRKQYIAGPRLESEFNRVFGTTFHLPDSSNIWRSQEVSPGKTGSRTTLVTPLVTFLVLDCQRCGTILGAGNPSRKLFRICPTLKTVLSRVGAPGKGIAGQNLPIRSTP